MIVDAQQDYLTSFLISVLYLLMIAQSEKRNKREIKENILFKKLEERARKHI